MLNLPGGILQLFGHAKAFDQGLGKERRGRGEIVVSLDGTGDVDKIEDALKLVGNGGSIFIKDGTYITSGFTLSNSNVWMRGSGQGTILKIRDSLGSNSECLTISGNDCVVENLAADCNEANNVSSQDGFEVSGQRNIITKCHTKNTGTHDAGIITTDGANDNMFINNSIYSISVTDSTTGTIIMGNTCTHATQSISPAFRGVCIGNVCPKIYVFGDSNVVIGNVTENAIGNDGANNVIANNIVA